MKPMGRQAQHAGRELVMNAKQRGLVRTIAWAVWGGVKRGPTVWAGRLAAAALLLAGLAALAGPAPVARAATITLTTCNATDLINAISQADSEGTNPGADTIVLPGTCTYTLTAVVDTNSGGTGLPPIRSDITIQGN